MASARTAEERPGFAYHIDTFGCQMNEHDSRRMAAMLEGIGGSRAGAPAQADVILVHTCSIRRKAEEKVYSLLGRYRAWKRRRPGRVLAVTGCVAQQEGERLLARAPHVDLVIGPHQVSRIDRLLDLRWRDGGRFVETAHIEGDTRDLECPGVADPAGVQAYVTIMEGCNNFCAYCVVPLVRGRERSRPARSILEEVRRLAGRGVAEITLLGQNVNAYRAPDRGAFLFPDLLSAVCEIRGVRRLRFTTSHPKDLSPELTACFGTLPALCEHIHLPLQAGSDRVLKAMRRGYTHSIYLERVAALRERCPEIGITTDLIVGFPGETEPDFLETLDVMRAVGFDGAYSFKYSPRPGTAAACRDDGVAEVEKVRRLKVLQELQAGITWQRNRAAEGRTVEILVEGRSRDGALWMGRTRSGKVVNASGPGNLLGAFVEVRIQQGCKNSLVGTVGAPLERHEDAQRLADQRLP